MPGFKWIRLLLAIITVVMVSCQPGTEKSSENFVVSADSTGNKQQPAESGYAEVNGLKMYYEVYGNGKPLVLLHGAFMNIPMNWSTIIPQLSSNRKVIVTELQGHGRTRDIDRPMSCENSADDVASLLQHLNIDSADVLGYSMGGGVAYQVAIRHPERVRRLVILSGAYAHDGWWPEAAASFGTINADVFKGSPVEKQYDSLGNDPAHFPEFVNKVMGMDRKHYDWSKEVKNIQSPVFIALGDADGLRYEHALDLFKAKGGGKMGDIHGLPQSRLAILPGTTHVGMMQHANWWMPMVTDFLDADLNAAPPGF